MCQPWEYKRPYNRSFRKAIKRHAKHAGYSFLLITCIYAATLSINLKHNKQGSNI